MTLLAYAVTETDEGTGGIYFAARPIDARKAGASDVNAGELGGLHCVRAPWADRFARNQVVPARVCVEHGWYFECWNCGVRIDSDWVDEGHHALGRVIGASHSWVFCSPKCRNHYVRIKRLRERAEALAIELMQGLVVDRFGDVEFSGKGHAYVDEHRGLWGIRSAGVAFNFPGMKHAPAVLRYSQPEHWQPQGPTRPYYTCAAGDQPAFEAWAAATRKAAP